MMAGHPAGTVAAEWRAKVAGGTQHQPMAIRLIFAPTQANNVKRAARVVRITAARRRRSNTKAIEVAICEPSGEEVAGLEGASVKR